LISAGHPPDFSEIRDFLPNEISEDADRMHGVLEPFEKIFIVVGRTISN